MKNRDYPEICASLAQKMGYEEGFKAALEEAAIVAEEYDLGLDPLNKDIAKAIRGLKHV